MGTGQGAQFVVRRVGDENMHSLALEPQENQGGTGLALRRELGKPNGFVQGQQAEGSERCAFTIGHLESIIVAAGNRLDPDPFLRVRRASFNCQVPAWQPGPGGRFFRCDDLLLHAVASPKEQTEREGCRRI